MSHSNGKAGTVDAGRVLVEELLCTALALGGVISSLLEEMPAETFQGEESAEVLLEMVVGSCHPAVAAAGEAECWAATALIAAVRERVFEDLRGAAELAWTKGVHNRVTSANGEDGSRA